MERAVIIMPRVGGGGWCIVKIAKLPLKYHDLVNVVTMCPLCSKQCLRQLLKEFGPSSGVPN